MKKMFYVKMNQWDVKEDNQTSPASSAQGGPVVGGDVGTFLGGSGGGAEIILQA